MFKKIILKNGLRFVLAPQVGNVAGTILVLVEAGSEYETKATNGISHFLEHLMFKGTTKRPRAGMIATELDSLGASYNAFTSQEYTGYWAKVQTHKVPQILELVSDLYLNPIFNEKEIEKERGVIIEEINMYEDTPMRRVQELFSSLLYGDQPAGWDIAGKKEIIRKLTREDFVKYRSLHYVAPKTTVVIAGSFNQARTVTMVHDLFGGLRRAPRIAKPKTKDVQKHLQTLVKFKESDQSHLVLGTRAFDVFDKRKYAIQVLADLLGGGMSSRLFYRVREELGAAYYINAETELMLDHGHFAVSAGVDHAKIEIVISAILGEMKRLSRQKVDKGELAKAKDHMIGGLILGLETSDELASFYGGQEVLTKKITTHEEIVKKVQRVTAEELRRVARSLFVNSKLNLAVIGPYKKDDRFKKILRF